jgi:hypothetical protein
MKRRYITLGLAVLLVLVLVAALAGPVSAKTVKIEFKTTSNATFVSEGKVTECGPYVYMWGNQIVARDDSSQPRLCGLRYVTENLKINTETGVAIGWGTYRIVVGTFAGDSGFTGFKPTGGIWLGSFTERINLIEGIGTGSAWGCGVKGSVAGLLVNATTEQHPFPDGSGAVVYETGCIIGR